VFSRRLPADLAQNALARAREAAGSIPFDLTVSNPTYGGIPYPPGLLDPLSGGRGLVYRPDPKGLSSARDAVAEIYARRGVVVDPERIVLTASSSEAYAFLFKVLCDPGDAILAPTPSYPLFEHLAALEGVRALPYRLDPIAGWRPVAPERPDAHSARAAILVHPNNPTGSWVDAEAAEQLAGSRGAGAALLPLIVDEVFLDFPLDPADRPDTFAARRSGLTFTLGGLSKSCGLPQLKLSWIVVGGTGSEADAAAERLEFVADNYLSVGSPVQEALPEILYRAVPVREAILARCRENLTVARALAAAVPAVEIASPGGGWSVVVRFPRVVPEEDLALELLQGDGVAVHPGYFFDFSTEGYLVASLLPSLDVFTGGLRRVLDAIARRL
jgi:alanine-synthesizing transaminase